MRMQRTIGLSLALFVAAAPNIAKSAQPGHQHPPSTTKSDAAEAETAGQRGGGKRHRAGLRLAARAHSRPATPGGDTERLPPPDQYIGPVQPIGTREIGHAAWYGGRHLGRRTASGERLDAVHATAAHRSLPLHSLVRVTNLRNGRSVIATITDRGPVSRRLLIDVSPSVAAELDMVYSGIATVSVEPVAAVQSQAH